MSLCVCVFVQLCDLMMMACKHQVSAASGNVVVLVLSTLSCCSCSCVDVGKTSSL